MWTKILAKLPFLGTALSFLKSKIRLAIEYVLIACVVALCAVTTTLWVQRNSISAKLDHTEEQVVSLTNEVGIQGATIDDLKSLRVQDAEALSGLLSDYKSLSQNDATVRDRLRRLEQTNEVVRKYLETPIPPELQCVLNDTCAATGDQGGKSGPARGTSR